MDACVLACEDWPARQMDLTTSSRRRGGSDATMTSSLMEQVRRLARQLPPHDAHPRYCHGPMSDDDKRRLEEFRDSRYRDALGQGTVHQLKRKTVCREVHTAVTASGMWNIFHLGRRL